MTILMDTEQIIVSFQSLWEGVDWDDQDDINVYIDVADPDEDIKKQRYPDEIVIPMKKIKVKYTYPLTENVTFDYETKNEIGFTRAELAKKVCEGYQKIYAHEEGVINDPTIKEKDKILPYEIWGHCIGDLLLYEVSQLEGNLFKLSVDS